LDDGGDLGLLDLLEAVGGGFKAGGTGLRLVMVGVGEARRVGGTRERRQRRTCAPAPSALLTVTAIPTNKSIA
jgi:hypothetical protein